MHYLNEWTLGDARQRYFERSGFGDGGYSDRWVKFKIGRIPLVIPNTKARVRAVKLHDLHHVLTEYDTTWTGEAEIAAWELASGCGRHYAAWIINLNAFALGLLMSPRTIYRAFLRGRLVGNLYAGQFEDCLLAKIVGETRHQLRMERPGATASPRDKLAFWTWASLVALGMACALALLAAVARLLT